VSIAISLRVWAHGPRDQNLRLTLLALADRMDDQGLTLPAFPGVQEIADRTCRTRRQATRNLRKLESEGWLTVERRTVVEPGRKGAKNRYRICLEKLTGERGACDTTMPHAHPRVDDTAMSHPSRLESDTAMSHTEGGVGDISSTEYVTFGVVVGDIATSSHNRKNVERNYNSGATSSLAIAAHIASTERALQSEQIIGALAQAIESEIKTGAVPADAGEKVLSQVRRYVGARDSGRFEIRGWSIGNLLAGGHWRDEQCWPWKPEHGPERKLRYVDPSTLYTGPEYQRRAEGV
jgi:hypothetical protein